jgi:hypothetical protein
MESISSKKPTNHHTIINRTLLLSFTLRGGSDDYCEEVEKRQENQKEEDESWRIIQSKKEKIEDPKNHSHDLNIPTIHTILIPSIIINYQKRHFM